MVCSLKVFLSDELRRYVDSCASDGDVYATPSEYIRDLIRRDMEERSIVSEVAKGLKETRSGRLVSESILDVLGDHTLKKWKGR